MIARSWRLSLPLSALFLTAACASSGGPALTGPDADAVFASYSGTWILDESSSSAQIPNFLEGVEDNQPMDEVGASRPGGLREERYLRRLRSRQADVGALRATMEVLRERPTTLTLQLDATTFSYRPNPGKAMALPMDGSEIDRDEGEHPVDAHIGWQDQFPVVEYTVPRGGVVRELMEAVGDRLIIRRSMSGMGEDATLILAYDRQS